MNRLLGDTYMKNSNEALIGLRGFLALSVLIYHIYNSSVLENYIVESPKNSLLYYMNFAHLPCIFIARHIPFSDRANRGVVPKL